MKLLIVALSLISTIAFAGNSCDADCSEVGQKCGDTCAKALKKDNADKIGFCKDKCKEFESECKKECKSDSKGKR